MKPSLVIMRFRTSFNCHGLSISSASVLVRTKRRANSLMSWVRPVQAFPGWVGLHCVIQYFCQARVSLAFFSIAAALACAACLIPKPMPNFANLKQEYLDGLFLAKPHLATFMGDHRFDGRLPDLSSRALALRRRTLEQQKIRLKAADLNALPADEQLDARILSDGIELELLYLNAIKEWEWEPRLIDSFPYYDPREIVATRILDILHGDFAPLEERIRSVSIQMKALPEFLAQVKSQLRKPSKIYTEQAIQDNRGRMEVFKSDLAEFISSASGIPPNLRSDAESARKSALAALEDYQRFLEKDVLPRSSGDWRLGAELFRRKFSLALQTDLTPEELLPRSETAMHQFNLELLQVSKQLYLKLFPGKPLPGHENDSTFQIALIRAVQSELSKDHPQADDFVSSHQRILNSLRTFVEEHNIVGLPPLDTLIVEAMPPFKRGVSEAEYLAPGILEDRSQWKATYFVDPVDPNWDLDRVESYLKDNNAYQVELTGMHEAYPGHHTQFYYSKRHLDPLRVVLWNAPFTEGWAVYGTTLMTRLGYGGDRNLRYVFFNLKGLIRMTMNILIDIQLHSGHLSEKDAVHFMVDKGFQEPAVADKKLLRAQLESTQLSQYFLGLEEIQQLEIAVRKAKGASFNQREFNETLIGHGPMPVRYLRNYFQLN